MSRPKDSIPSMTGYGRATKRTSLGTVTVELRSTNHRYLDIDQRLPGVLTVLQGRLAGIVRSHVKRGRVEAVLTVQFSALDRRRVMFDEKLLRGYYEALVQLKGRFGLQGPVTLDHVLSLPQAITVVDERTSAEELWAPIRDVFESAVRELARARRCEGAKLVADLRRQLGLIERHVRGIMRRLPRALEAQRRRLRERLQDLLGSAAGASGAQLEQAAALAKEADIHEELVRLHSHLGYMRQALAARASSHDGVGKRLDFIAQEMLREVNTMGAKVNDAEAAQHVVDVKGCIEKIREQVQNLE